VSSSGPASALTAERETWRPMAFGFKSAKGIKDPVCEPLWAGRRTIADVRASGVELHDEVGDSLEGFADLRAAIKGSSVARELVIDGYLLPAPLRDTVGAEALIGDESAPTARQMLLLGGGGTNRRKEELRNAEERRVRLTPEGPTAFMAVDLLWLDGESLLDVPLLERKRLLDSALVDHELVRRTMIVRPPVEAWYAQWRALGFREFAIKSANSRYRPGTASDAWTTQPIPRR